MKLRETEELFVRGFEEQFIITFVLYSIGSHSEVFDLSSILSGLKNISHLKLLNFAYPSLCNHKTNWLVWLPGDIEKLFLAQAFLDKFQPKSGKGMYPEYGVRLTEKHPEAGPRLLKALNIISGLLGKCCPAVVITDAL